MKNPKFIFALKKWLILPLAILFLTTSCSEDGWKNVSGKANDFTMTAFDGKVINSSDLKGKVILLEFWDTHCGPCLQLMPEMAKLSDKYKDNPNVAIIVINAGWEPLDNAKAFMDKKAFTFNSAYMTKKLSRELGVSTLPTTIIIGKDFNLKFKHLGFDEKTEMAIVTVFDSHIQSLLK